LTGPRQRRVETIPILASLLPASFQPGFTIIRAPVWPTRLLRGTKDPRHRFVRRQWLLATIPFILPFLFCFTTFPVFVPCSCNLSSYLYISRRKCMENIQALRNVKQRPWQSFWNFVTFTTIFRIAVKQRLLKYRFLSRLRATTSWM